MKRLGFAFRWRKGWGRRFGVVGVGVGVGGGQ